MANRRMFSLDVIDTDIFLEMPATSQSLYFHLGMRADDDGFVSAPKKITKLVNCGSDDLQILISRGYVLPFENGVIVLRHWGQNNYIQKDRYKQTIYTKELEMMRIDNGVYSLDTDCIQDVSKLYPQVRLGKVSIDKNNKDISSEPNKFAPPESGILLPLVDKSSYDVPLDKITMWEQAYPGVNVKQELYKMLAWLDSNPTKQKTARGITRFINSWLEREQNSGRAKGVKEDAGTGRQRIKSANEIAREIERERASGNNLD